MLKFITIALIYISMVQAFAPLGAHVSKTKVQAPSNTQINGLFGEEEEERKALTRDSEPEDFFATNTDKMSDEEKIPIAVAGLLGISLPFIFGLIALYASK